ncbi:amidohydrolase family protein [Jatrophihabitans fulvus]
MAVLLRGARLVDPADGSDAAADLRVRDGRIAGRGPLVPEDGDEVVDVTGLVLGPGFVDLHSHVDSVAGHRLQALDGVTTALDLESGLMPIEDALRRATDQGRPLNFGFSASWAGARARVLSGTDPDGSVLGALHLLDDPRWQQDSTPEQLAAWLDLIEHELAHGGLGIGVTIGYAPRTDPAEFLAVARLAARADVPVYSHVRELIEVDPTTPIDGSEELAIAAAETGARMHHCHVNSTSRRHVDRVLRTLDRARAEGSQITVEAYPYGAGTTAIGAAFLTPESLHRWGIGPSSLTVLTTGERVGDEARLLQLRASDPGAPCVVEFLDESNPSDAALLQRALAYPDAIVASDALPVLYATDGATVADTDVWPLPPGGATHPRTAGTFTKALRTMVREQGAWTWAEAFRRCSYLPARVLDDVAPAMRRKGTLAVGADADLVVLDPDRVTDAATYADPTRPSEGVRHLLVNGEFVVRDGSLVTDARPGRAVRGEPR